MRSTGARLFDYRISRTQRALDEFQKQRDETIEKLKVATKYNSTQQLLEKYGGESPKPSPSPKARAEKQKPSAPPQQPVARTGLPPPPTANIRRPPSAQPSSGPGTPPSPPPYQNPVQQQQPFSNAPPSPPPVPQPQLSADEPGFAPNAFPSQGQYIEQPHWYDRLLDVLLGEDEMQPRNRMAMICSSCRLVNGQAPPGIKTPEELGRWRCGSCGAWNGVESETTKILSSLRQNAGRAEGNWESQSEGHPDGEGTVDDGALVGSSEEGQHTPSQDSEDFEQTPDEQPEASQGEPVQRSKRGKGSKSK